MKTQINNCVANIITDFLYYDRQEDDDLPIGEIEKAVASGEITVNEMVSTFKSELEKALLESNDES